MTEHPGLETPGGRIRAAREGRGLSLEEMSESTKIPPKVLAAIEDDDYHKVSGALYIKSFLRSCATELGLDADEILDLYGRFSGDAGPTGGGAKAVWEEEEVQISRVGLPWRNIALVAFVIVAIGFGATFLVRGCNSDGHDPDQNTTAPVENESLLVADHTAGGSVTPGSVLAEAASDTLVGSGRDLAPSDSGPGSDGDMSSARPVDDSPSGVATREASSESDTSAAEAVVSGNASGEGAEARAPAVANENPDTQRSLPLPLVGGPNLIFADGVKKPVVLRVIADGEVGLEVKSDAETAFTRPVWAPPGGSYPPLPPTGIVAGRVYAVRRGLVIYWGAYDHISLKLDSTEDVEVMLNGSKRDISRLRPGAELLLDLSGN